LRLVTPADERMYGSMVTFEISGVDKTKFLRLARERNMWLTGFERMRVSAHIHTRPRDIDMLFSTLAESRL